MMKELNLRESQEYPILDDTQELKFLMNRKLQKHCVFEALKIGEFSEKPQVVFNGN